MLNEPLLADSKRQAVSDSSIENVATMQIECESTVFNRLDIDSLYEVLDFLPLKSLCALNKTCKSLRHTTKRYFLWKYPSQDFSVGDEFIYNANHIECFGDVVQELELFDSSEKDFEFTGININKHLRQIEFTRTYKEDNKIGKQHIDSIANILENIKNVRAINCDFGNNFEYLLDQCKNIEHFSFKIDKDLSTTKFQFEKYPTLRNIEIHFQAKAKIPDAMTMIKEQNVKLVELVLLFRKEHNSFMVDVFNDLNLMYEKGCFKRLYLMFEKKAMLTEHIDKLISVGGLEGFTCSYTINTKVDNHIADVSKLQKIKFLNINALLENADQLAQELQQLDELEISDISMDALISFVCYSPTLKRFHIGKIRGNNTNFDAIILNGYRSMLEYAHKLVIYVPEEKFIKLKWSSTTMDTNLIEIKRIESCIPIKKDD